MAGTGRTPKDPSARVHRGRPQRGDYVTAVGVGWQHGRRPAAPAGLLEPSRRAWSTWMDAWFAAHWTPADVPALRQLIRLYDQVERGDFVRAPELRLWLDTMGVTPKGQQDRRWRPPATSAEPAASSGTSGQYRHLRSVPDGEGVPS